MNRFEKLFFPKNIKFAIKRAHQNVYSSINKAMLEAYWLIGKRIVEENQKGDSKATYGASTLKTLSEELQKEFGRGFSIRNLEQMRAFYLVYPKTQTVSAFLDMPDFQLSWSHYQILLRISDKNERQFYEIEAAQSKWSLREFKRQYNSGLYLRLALSTDKEGIKKLATEGQIFETAQDAVKDPYVLEFLNLKSHYRYSESELENEIIDKLEYFLLEMGKGFTFVA